MINSPNNPTGWTIARADQQAILDHCRRHGIWIIADDVYERLVYDGSACAPSFLDLGGSEDRLISTNSFSKSWLMTGWRLGWIVAPEALMPDLGKLIEYNTSCSPVFVQRAGVAAITDGEPTIAHTLQRYRAARDMLVSAPCAHAADCRRAAARRDVRVLSRGWRDGQPRILQAPGARGTPGPGPGERLRARGEGFVRWCFASSQARLADGIARLECFLR